MNFINYFNFKEQENFQNPKSKCGRMHKWGSWGGGHRSDIKDHIEVSSA